MNKTYKAVIAGYSHVHVHNVALIFKRHPRIELVACADTPPLVPELSRGPYSRAFNRDYLVNQVGIPRAYDDYRQMLDKEKPDLVICNSENSQHPNVVEACAQRRAHVCVEKPMAASLADARRMIRAAESAGIALLVHWYMPFSTCMLRVKALLDEGAIGRILEVKMRAAHAGPLAPGARHPGPNVETLPMTGPELAATWWYQAAAGGGAMIDFCSYGAILSRWFLQEQAATAMGLRANLNSPWADADDHGTIVARFSSAVGTFEGSWTTVAPGAAGGPVVYGTEGTLTVDECCDQPSVTVLGRSGRSTRYEGLPLPEGRASVADAIVHHLETREPLHPVLDMRINAEATAIVDAGLRSAASGRHEPVEPLAAE